MEIMSIHCEKLLRKEIESRKGKKIEEGVLSILENLHYLTEKVEGPNGEEKSYLPTKVKQMVFHVVCPNGRISKAEVVIKNVWAEVTMSVYEDKNDEIPIGTYTSIGIYESVYLPISSNEKMKKAIEMAKGAALSRAFTRMGIGLEFFTDFEFDETVDLSMENQQSSIELQQQEQLEASLTVPEFVSEELAKENGPAEDVSAVETTEEIKEKEASEEPVEKTEVKLPETEEPIQPSKKRGGRKKKEVVETKTETETAVEAPAIMEVSSVEVLPETEDAQQISFIEDEEPENTSMTLEEAFATKTGFGNFEDTTLGEMVKLGKERLIWKILSRTTDERIKTAIELVVKELRKKDKEFDDYVKMMES